MAEDLTGSLAQMIAQNRQGQQQIPMGSGPQMGRLPALETVKNPGLSAAGAAFGKGAGDIVGDVATKKVMWDTDPTTLYKRAEMAQAHWNTMTPDEQAKMMENPQFVDTMAKFQKSAPELFTSTANGQPVPAPLPMQEALQKNQFYHSLGMDPKKFDLHFMGDAYKKAAETYEATQSGKYKEALPDIQRRENDIKEHGVNVQKYGHELDFKARMAHVEAIKENNRLERSMRLSGADKEDYKERLAGYKSSLDTAKKAGEQFAGAVQKIKLDPQKSLYAGGSNSINMLGELVVSGLGALTTAVGAYEDAHRIKSGGKMPGPGETFEAPQAKAISGQLLGEIGIQANILSEKAGSARNWTPMPGILGGTSPREDASKNAPILLQYANEVFQAYPTKANQVKFQQIQKLLEPYMPKEAPAEGYSGGDITGGMK